MIECRDSTKKYNELFAVDRLSLKLERGDVYGFIGPNGSGKTTTMRMLATLLNPSWGEATVCGYSIYTGSKEIRRSIGYMPDFFGVYDDMKVTEYLEFFAAAYRITGPDRRKKVEQVLEYVDLGYKRDALVTSLSRGMTQRLGLARVLLHEPQVLLLDEPASGLDPRARIEMRELIKQLRKENKTIMVSSHILPELADICNKIGIIERGKLIWNGTVDDAINEVRGKAVFTVIVGGERNAEAAHKIETYSEVESAVLDPKTGAIDVRLKDAHEDGSFLPERLIQAGFRLKAFKEKEVNIEDVFMRITKGITSYGVSEFIDKMRILVTGGAGYIGSHTVRMLVALGHDVTVFDNLSFGHRAAVPSTRLVIGDLRDADHLDQVLVVNRIEAVIHFAAYCYVGESVTDPAKYYANNLVNSLSLIDRCRRNGITRFVFSSTCATYGVPTAVPITEDEKQVPINPYGHTKLAVEYALADYACAYPFGFCALRYFNAAGAAADGSLGEDHNPETHLIPLVLQAALGKRPHVEIFGTDYPTPDGTCLRGYVHVDDLAAAHILALEKVAPHSRLVYNVGIGRGYSVREVIETARAVTGKPIAVIESPRRPGDPPVLVANADQIRCDLGWSPAFPELRAIIASAWNWHRNHPDGYGG